MEQQINTLKARPFVSIKTKIILIIGSLITILLITISLTVLYQWRSLIVKNLEQRAYSVTQAFSVSIIDAFIYQENNSFHADDFIESYILDFIQKDPTVKYVGVFGNNNQVVGHSDPTILKKKLNRFEKKVIEQTKLFTYRINKDKLYGWILEADLPLKISGKRWGLLRIGFDAGQTRADIKTLFMILFFTTVVGNIIILVVLYLLTSRLTSSLGTLVTAMDKVDLETKPYMPLQGDNNEIGFLVYHFNEMQKRLKGSQTNLINAQIQIHQAEKLASIGRLVTGIAHEVNNPLNGIKSCIFSIQQEPENKDLRQKYLDLITEGVNHIEIVVQKLLGFARQPSSENGKNSDKEMVSVNHSIEKVLALLSYKLEKNEIKQRMFLDPLLPLIKINPNQLEEVFMNLIINGYDALDKGGTLSISSSINDNEQVEISVKDNGDGIKQDALEFIFEPFFTTKKEGKGTGLGLAVSKGIIEANGGKLEVISKPGKETIFKVILNTH